MNTLCDETIFEEWEANFQIRIQYMLHVLSKYILLRSWMGTVASLERRKKHPYVWPGNGIKKKDWSVWTTKSVKWETLSKSWSSPTKNSKTNFNVMSFIFPLCFIPNDSPHANALKLWTSVHIQRNNMSHQFYDVDIHHWENHQTAFDKAKCNDTHTPQKWNK